MSSIIPPKFRFFVDGLIINRQYESESDVIAAALTLLQKEQDKPETIRRLLQPSIDALDRGEGIDVPFDKIDEFFDEIIRESEEELRREGKLP